MILLVYRNDEMSTVQTDAADIKLVHHWSMVMSLVSQARRIAAAIFFKPPLVWKIVHCGEINFP